MGKFLSGFTFSLLVCREKQTKPNAQKVRRCKIKVEILWILWWSFVLFWVFGCLGFFLVCVRVVVVVESITFNWEKKKKRVNRLLPVTVSHLPSLLLIYKLIFFKVLHIQRYCDILALVF